MLDVDAKTAEEVLIKMFPGAKIAADVKAEQINAYASPTDQAAIKATIEQMQAQNPPDKKPRLEVYPVRDQDHRPTDGESGAGGPHRPDYVRRS